MLRFGLELCDMTHNRAAERNQDIARKIDATLVHPLCIVLHKLWVLHKTPRAFD